MALKKIPWRDLEEMVTGVRGPRGGRAGAAHRGLKRGQRFSWRSLLARVGEFQRGNRQQAEGDTRNDDHGEHLRYSFGAATALKRFRGWTSLMCNLRKLPYANN